jgi:hypothetical protein
MRNYSIIEIDGDVTSPSTVKQTHRTVTDKLMNRWRNLSWRETVFDKGLTFDFFRDPVVRKSILVTVQYADSIITFSTSSSKDMLLTRRKGWTHKILPTTDAHL